MRIDSPEHAHEQSMARLEALRQYAGTECFTHLVGLLEALRTQYLHELAYVSADKLGIKQGAARQVAALLNALTGPHADGARI